MSWRLRTPLLLLVLFCAAWLPRILVVGRFVTPDERKWLTRSANFYQAISHGDFAQTFQREHPGVTIMWAGMAGFLTTYPTYIKETPGFFAWDGEDLEAWLYQHSIHSPMALLVAGREWVVLLVALLIALSYFPLRRLLGATAALFSVLFVAWDPFYWSLSHHLHPDGLVTSLTFLALLCFLVWLYDSESPPQTMGIGSPFVRTPLGWYLFGSSVLMGLAWLTKIPALVLAPTGGILVLLQLRHRSGRQFRTPHSTLHIRLLGYALWGCLALGTFVLLWPAMWVAPIYTLTSTVSEMSSYVESHVNPDYFWGRPTGDPGLFFYPVVLLFRTTPATLLGLVAAGWLAWRRHGLWANENVRRVAGALLLFALLFTIGMSVGAKKFDRYLLPIFPALDVLAALGWLALIQLIFARKFSTVTRSRQALSPYHLVTLSALLLHALPGLLHYPYYYFYYNPLFGGTATATHTLMVGWGEGLEAAAEWVNQQPNAERARVVAWYGDGPLSYFLKNKAPVLSFWSPEFWFAADYAILYINQWQRNIPSIEVADYFANQKPVHVVQAGGLDIARIYDLRQQAPPDFTGLYTESATTWADQIRFAAYAVGRHNFLSGDQFTIRLYWADVGQQVANYASRIRLLAPDGTEVASSAAKTTGQPGAIWSEDHPLIIPEHAPDGEYKLLLSVRDAATSQQRLGEGEHLITRIQVSAARKVALHARWPSVQLTQLQTKPQIAAGQTLVVDLLAQGETAGTLKLSARLVDSAGSAVAQLDKVLTAQMRFEFELPGDLPTGNYDLVVVSYDPATLAAFPDDQGQLATVLTQIEVQSNPK